jgi:hypothetical protein
MRVFISEAICEGSRRLRREEQLPVGASGRDRVRAQDADPSVVLQQGLLVPEG